MINQVVAPPSCFEFDLSIVRYRAVVISKFQIQLKGLRNLTLFRDKKYYRLSKTLKLKLFTIMHGQIEGGTIDITGPDRRFQLENLQGVRAYLMDRKSRLTVF